LVEAIFLNFRVDILLRAAGLRASITSRARHALLKRSRLQTTASCFATFATLSAPTHTHASRTTIARAVRSARQRCYQHPCLADHNQL